MSKMMRLLVSSGPWDAKNFREYPDSTNTWTSHRDSGWIERLCKGDEIAVVSPSQGLCSEEIVLQRPYRTPQPIFGPKRTLPNPGDGEGRMPVCTAPVLKQENRAQKTASLQCL